MSGLIETAAHRIAHQYKSEIMCTQKIGLVVANR